MQIPSLTEGEVGIKVIITLRCLKMLFHSIRRPVRLGPDTRDGRLTPKNGVKKRRRVRLGCSLGCPTICLPETK